MEATGNDPPQYEARPPPFERGPDGRDNQAEPQFDGLQLLPNRLRVAIKDLGREKMVTIVMIGAVLTLVSLIMAAMGHGNHGLTFPCPLQYMGFTFYDATGYFGLWEFCAEFGESPRHVRCFDILTENHEGYVQDLDKQHAEAFADKVLAARGFLFLSHALSAALIATFALIVVPNFLKETIIAKLPLVALGLSIAYAFVLMIACALATSAYNMWSFKINDVKAGSAQIVPWFGWIISIIVGFFAATTAAYYKLNTGANARRGRDGIQLRPIIQD